VESAIALQKEDPEIQLGMFLGPPASLAYAVRRDEPELLKALNEYIDNLRRTQTWNRLVVKYFGAAAPEILRKARAE
jgi:ABC-type amino acid transport substrate-binding protein